MVKIITQSARDKSSAKQIGIPMPYCHKKKIAKNHTITTNEGEVIEVTDGLKGWCIKNDVSSGILYASVNKGIIKPTKHTSTNAREKLLGWCITRP